MIIMMNFSITPEPPLSALDGFLHIEQNKIKLATVRALNKTARWLRTDISRNTAKDLNINVSLIRNNIKIQRAKRRNLEAVVGLDSRSGVINAFDLGTARQDSCGVRVGRRRFDRAFIARMNNGHTGVFRRKGKERLPINEVYLVITGKLAKQLEKMEDGKGTRQFQKVFERELLFLTRAN